MAEKKHTLTPIQVETLDLISRRRLNNVGPGRVSSLRSRGMVVDHHASWKARCYKARYELTPKGREALEENR
jgi:hypothetical protein